MATSVHVVTRCKNVHNKGALTREHTLPSSGVSDMVELTVDDRSYASECGQVSAGETVLC